MLHGARQARGHVGGGRRRTLRASRRVAVKLRPPGRARAGLSKRRRVTVRVSARVLIDGRKLSARKTVRLITMPKYGAVSGNAPSP